MESEARSAATDASLVVPAREGRPGLDLGRHVHCLFGLVFDAVDTDTAVLHLRRCAREKTPCFLSTPNLNFAITALGDAAFRASVQHSDLSVADGSPIVWLARLLGLPLRERVAGSDLFERLRQPGPDRPLRVFFFGGPPGIAERAALRLNEEAGGLRCVGFESPGFGSVADMSSEATISRINTSDADFVVVALGAKKGQAWIEHNRARLTAPLISHLGAVVNFVAGSVRRAPLWMQRTGFEWLWRIVEEPTLWRRYAGDGLALVRIVATQLLPALIAGAMRSETGTLPGTLQAVHQGTSVTLLLQGRFTSDALPALRLAMSTALRCGSTVQLDLSATTAVDSAFLAIALLLDSWQPASRAIVAGSVRHPAVLAAVRCYGAYALIDV